MEESMDNRVEKAGIVGETFPPVLPWSAGDFSWVKRWALIERGWWLCVLSGPCGSSAGGLEGWD
jgi:hypothetical protein